MWQLFGDRLSGLETARNDASAMFDRGSAGESVAHRLMALDQARFLPDNILVKADRATMLASLEMRTPFLSRELAEFAASIPTPVHLRGRGKWLLREILGEVLPSAQRGAKKTAFRVPLSDWLRCPLADMLRTDAHEGAGVGGGWINGPVYRRMTAEHIDGNHDHAVLLWPALVLSTWLTNKVSAG
jgi:asparagine synthase (glutamine-hydrolysing)